MRGTNYQPPVRLPIRSRTIRRKMRGEISLRMQFHLRTHKRSSPKKVLNPLHDSDVGLFDWHDRSMHPSVVFGSVHAEKSSLNLRGTIVAARRVACENWAWNLLGVRLTAPPRDIPLASVTYRKVYHVANEATERLLTHSGASSYM